MLHKHVDSIWLQPALPFIELKFLAVAKASLRGVILKEEENVNK